MGRRLPFPPWVLLCSLFLHRLQGNSSSFCSNNTKSTCFSNRSRSEIRFSTCFHVKRDRRFLVLYNLVEMISELEVLSGPVLYMLSVWCMFKWFLCHMLYLDREHPSEQAAINFFLVPRRDHFRVLFHSFML